MIPTGSYVHFKGGRYRVVGVAIHRETGTQWVVYHKLYGEDRGLEVKTLEEFTERVERGEYKGPRYKLEYSNAKGP